MSITRGAGPVWYALYVRTPGGEVWEPACQHVRSLALALKVARLLHDFLAGAPAAQVGAPQWAADVRDAIAGDGDDPARCAVEARRGRPGHWSRAATVGTIESVPRAARTRGPKVHRRGPRTRTRAATNVAKR